MTLTQQQIAERLKKGVKLVGANGERVTLKKPVQEASEIDYLRLIADMLIRQSEAPAPTFVVPEPKVVVQPSPVQTSPKPIKKWRFQVEKDHRGWTKEIIATAVE